MRKQLHYVTLFLLLFTSYTLIGENYIDLYIDSYKDIAIREMERSGIPASITLAQGIHESSWGKGELAVKSNNHFGIKCKSYWTGQSFYYKDDDYDKNGNLIKSCFRAYENPEKSYIDHTDFLMNTAHYQELFGYSKTDYKRWAKGLKKCGYATDKEYANKLIRTIEKYQLYRFDMQMQQQELAQAPTYNIPNKDFDQLFIPSNKAEERQYSMMYVPPAVPIPADYKRKPKKVFLEHNNATQNDTPQQTIQKEKIVFEEIGSGNSGMVLANNEKETYANIQTEQPTLSPIEYNATIKKESIIPSAFASTKRTYLLARKPRSSNSNIR